MKKYLYQIQTTVAAQTWKIEMTMASDDMALEYGARIVKDFVGIRWFMKLLVFCLYEPGRLVGEITIAEPRAIIHNTGEAGEG
jgi:hypothetical protein